MTKFLTCATCGERVPYLSNDHLDKRIAQDWLDTYHTPEYHALED